MISFEESGTKWTAFRRKFRKLCYRLLPAGKTADLQHISYSGVLRTRKDFRRSEALLEKLDLPLHNDRPKNWDGLAAFALITRHKPDRATRVLDAGGEYYSPILRQLELNGYHQLTCINLVFKDRFSSKFLKRGNIIFEYGDITQTRYPAGSFGAITCLSVVEHGVDMDLFFKEMSRLLEKDGLLFVSTDYWEQQVDTAGKVAYGVPVRIFNAADIRSFAGMAEKYGLRLMAPLALECEDKVVRWKEFDLNYTFIYFTFLKV